MRKRNRQFFNYRKNQPWTENLQLVMQLGLTMAGCILFCFFIGLWLGEWLGLKGLFITVFTLLGVAGGAVVAYRQIMEVFEDDSSSGSDNGDS